MMPSLGRTSAVVALLMLASVATASAECAWVLWVGESYDAGIGHPWSLLHAATAQADCLDAMGRAVEGYKEKMGSKAQIGRDARDPWAVMIFGEGHSVTLRCLPDTIDPRGPKAK